MSKITAIVEPNAAEKLSRIEANFVKMQQRKYSTQDSGRPESLSYKRWNIQKTAHSGTKFLLQGIQHCHITSAPHDLGEEKTS